MRRREHTTDTYISKRNADYKLEAEITSSIATVDDDKGPLLIDEKNSLPRLLLSCELCNDYKTNDAFDMELHLARKHKQELELLSLHKDACS